MTRKTKHKTVQAPAPARQQLAPLDNSQRYDVPEALSYLRIGRKKFYENVAAGTIKIIKDGRRTFVPGAEIARLSRPEAA